MKRTIRSLSVTAGLVALAAVPVQAQNGNGSFGIHGAYFDPGRIAEGPQETLNFDETFGPGAELEFWFGGSKRIGLGLQGSWTNWNEWDTDFGGDFGTQVQMFQYDASLQFRLADVDLNSTFVPFISLGAGAVTVNPDDEKAFDGAPTMDFDPADVQLDTETHTEFALVGGIGTDIFVSRSVALRLEAKDYWTNRSPYQRLSTSEFHDGGHNLLFTAGLNFYWGAEGVEEPGFIQEELEVYPEPEPAPEPEPEPTTETVSVCVVGDGGNLETVTATRYVEDDRVVVDRNGMEVEFDEAYPAEGPVYVEGESWFMRDEPLSVRLTDTEGDTEEMTAETDGDISRLEWVRFGSRSTMSASNLVYVGSVDGTPMYVSRTDAGPMTTRIRSALATEDDLETILRSDTELARELADVETFYVAVEPGCVFQPISLTTYVRATRGQ